MKHPRNTAELIGHEDAFASFFAAKDAGHLHHAWLISGPKGIGKATFAYTLAKELLTGEGALQRIENAAHADLLTIEPEYDEKKGEYKREINVEQTRAIGGFLSLTAAEGNQRIIIVDSADELNANAANAILKNLEEPPSGALFLLISHNPARLLPTIRSRCRSLKLNPLNESQCARILSQLAPELDEDEAKALSLLGNGSPGLAHTLQQEQGLSIYGNMMDVLAKAPNLNAREIHAFAESMLAGKPHAGFRTFSHLMLYFLASLAKEGHIRIMNAEAEAAQTLKSLKPTAFWNEKWFATLEQFSLAERFHLDYKTVVITFFHELTQIKATAAA